MLKTLAKRMLGVMSGGRRTGKGAPSKQPRQPLVGERVIDGVPVYDIRTLLMPHAEIIEYTRQASAHQGKSGQYTFDTLFVPVIEAFATYAHHLPASESHHHNYPGGLLTHSLQVANRALRYAKGQHLSHVGMLDKEPLRLSRYLFAAWTCGLLHDAGKIYADIRVIDAEQPNNEWLPLVENILAWAERTNVQRYIVRFRSDRIHKRHETVSLHLLQQVLSTAAKTYISTCPDDLFTEMSEALTGYESRKGYLQDAVRTADHISTAQDLRTIWDKSLGPREASLIEIIIKTMQHLMPAWRDHSTPHMVVLANEVYLRWPECLDGIIASLNTHDIPCPSSAGRLHELMVERGVIRGHIGERVAHFYEDVTDKAEALDIILGRDARPFIPVVRLEWAFHAVGDSVIPPNRRGLLKLTKEGESLLFGGPDAEVKMISLDEVKEASASSKPAAPSLGAAAPAAKVETTSVPAPLAATEPEANEGTNTEQPAITDLSIELAPSIDEILGAGGKPVKSGILRLAAADVDPPQPSEPKAHAKKQKGKAQGEAQPQRKAATVKAKPKPDAEHSDVPVRESAAGEVRRVEISHQEAPAAQEPASTAAGVNSQPRQSPWHRPGDTWCEADGYLEQFVSAKPSGALVVVGDAVWVTESALRTVFGDDTQDVLTSMIKHRYLAKPVALPHLAIVPIPKAGGRGIALRPQIAKELQGLMGDRAPDARADTGGGVNAAPQQSEKPKPRESKAPQVSQPNTAATAEVGQAPALAVNTKDSPAKAPKAPKAPARTDAPPREESPGLATATNPPVAADWAEWLASWLGCRMADADVESSDREMAMHALRRWGIPLTQTGAIARLREREGVKLNVAQFMAFTDKQPTAERAGLWKVMACMTRCGRTEATATSKIVIVEAPNAENS